MTPADAEYLHTGRSDPMHSDWPGPSFVERARRAEEALTDALVQEVRARARGRAPESPTDVAA